MINYKLIFLMSLMILSLSFMVEAKDPLVTDCVSQGWCEWLRDEVYVNDPYTPYDDCMIGNNQLICYYPDETEKESTQPSFQNQPIQDFSSCPSNLNNPFNECHYYEYDYESASARTRIIWGTDSSYYDYDSSSKSHYFNPSKNSIYVKCEGDRFYLYDDNFDSNKCDENGCSGFLDLFDTFEKISFDPSNYGTIKPYFVCWDYNERNGYYAWSWSNIEFPKLLPSRVQCNSDSECLIEQECYAENKYNTQCMPLVCDNNQVIKDHKCVDVELPNLCAEADITDVQECGIYLVEYFDILQGTLQEKEEQIKELGAEIERKIALVQELEGNIEEQADLINRLSDTLEEKIEIVKALQLNIGDQAEMIESLTDKVEEQAQYIKQLEDNIADQSELISNLEDKRQQQAQLIEELTDEIDEQAEYIKQLAKNLAQKEAYVDELEAENKIQAGLIKEMRESFARQGEIIDALNLEIEDDAQIIKNLRLSLSEQGEIIANMELTIQEQKEIIQELTQKVEEQGQIIEGMKLNIQQQAELINELTDKIEEQKDLIIQLKLSIEEEEELVNELQSELEKANQLIEEIRETRNKTKLYNRVLFISLGIAILIIGWLIIRKRQ